MPHLPEPLRVLVNSSDAALANALDSALRLPGFALGFCQPGASFMQAARSHHPQIAVIDRVHERGPTVQMEIAVLKELWSEVRIIVLSHDPSPADASVVEQGVFYYLAAPSPAKVVAVVNAAAVALRRDELRVLKEEIQT